MTWAPTPEILAAALAHAEACQPLESCGVVADGEFVAIPNKATDLDTFVMDMRAFCRLEAEHQKIEAIVHSHVYGQPTASDADRAMCEAVGKPWLIVAWPLGTHAVIEPCGYRAPLVGRKWAWGTHDCFGLIRDGMHDYAGIDLPEFPRDWLWWERGENIIADQFAEAGFVPVDDGWRHCDVMGMRIWPSKVVNHLGLFLYPDVMLHQLLGRNSVREVYGGVYQSATLLHLRHRELLAAPPPIPADHPLWGKR
jgi:proteasome lid subunit RPN8/RPN11